MTDDEQKKVRRLADDLRHYSRRGTVDHRQRAAERLLLALADALAGRDEPDADAIAAAREVGAL